MLVVTEKPTLSATRRDDAIDIVQSQTRDRVFRLHGVSSNLAIQSWIAYYDDTAR